MEEHEATTSGVRSDREGVEQAKALNKVTDVAPDKLLDEDKTARAVSAMTAARKMEKEAQRAKERELASVRIKRSDVMIIVQEFEVQPLPFAFSRGICKGG